MSAEKKRMATELRSGKYPEWIFGDADHRAFSNDAEDLFECVIHTEYPRFMARIAANEAAYESIAAIPAGVPLVKAIYGFGLDTQMVVTWEIDGEVAELAFSHFVNLDGAAFETNKVLDRLGEAAQYWVARIADENNAEAD